MSQSNPPPLARAAFALESGTIYLNHAAVGVLPIRTRDAVRAFVDAHATRGVIGVAPYEAAIDEQRAAIGAFFGATGDEIALLRNTGDGANIVAQGLDLGPGDEILTQRNEFGSNAYPWLACEARGARVRFIDAPHERMTPDVLARHITPQTRVVAVSWVTFNDGYRHDLAALAEVTHRAGAFFAVDAIQGLGAFPLDVRACGIDAMYFSGAKWLLALQGIGVLYLAREHLDRIALRIPGWRSVADIWDFLDYAQGPLAGAARYEGGTPNFVGALSLVESIAVLQEASGTELAAHILALTDRLVDGLHARGSQILSDRTVSTRSGIVTFLPRSEDPLACGQRIAAAGIVTTTRATGIRVSPHGYNTTEEIDAFLAQIR